MKKKKKKIKYFDWLLGYGRPSDWLYTVESTVPPGAANLALNDQLKDSVLVCNILPTCSTISFVASVYSMCLIVCRPASPI